MDNKKFGLIISVFVLLGIVFSLGIFIGMKYEKGKLEDKEDTKEVEEKKEEVEYSSEGLIENDLKEPVTINKKFKLGDKDFTITYSVSDEEVPPYGGAVTLKINDNVIVDNYAGLYKVKYKVFGDNSDYLFISYYIPWHYNGLIINKDGQIIKKMSSFDQGCTMTLGKDSLLGEDEMIYEKNNKIYYYKYVSKSGENDYDIKMDLIEISINNDEINEKTISQVDGNLVQCIY